MFSHSSVPGCSVPTSRWDSNWTIQSVELFEGFLEESAPGFYPVLGGRQGLAGRKDMAW